MLASFAVVGGAGLLLHLGTGLADQGDLARSTAFLLESPAPAAVVLARAVTGEPRYSMRVGSLPARAATLAAHVGLLALALAEAPLLPRSRASSRPPPALGAAPG